MVSSSLLFYLGILFAYFAVFPLIFAFFTSTAPEGVLVMTDINAYLSFVLKLFFADKKKRPTVAGRALYYIDSALTRKRPK